MRKSNYALHACNASVPLLRHLRYRCHRQVLFSSCCSPLTRHYLQPYLNQSRVSGSRSDRYPSRTSSPSLGLVRRGATMQIFVKVSSYCLASGESLRVEGLVASLPRNDVRALVALCGSPENYHSVLLRLSRARLSPWRWSPLTPSRMLRPRFRTRRVSRFEGSLV